MIAPAASGIRRTFELFVRGGTVPAAEALGLGLVNQVVPHEGLLDAALAWCDRIARLPEHVVSMTKPLMRAAADMSWQHALVTEEFAEPMTLTTAAHQKAVEPLLAKAARAVSRRVRRWYVLVLDMRYAMP